MNPTLLRSLALTHEINADKKNRHVVDLIIEAYEEGFKEAEKMYKEVMETREKMT